MIRYHLQYPLSVADGCDSDDKVSDKQLKFKLVNSSDILTTSVSEGLKHAHPPLRHEWFLD